MSDRNVEFYGFTPVPRDPEVLFQGHLTASGPNPKQDLFVVTDFPLPVSPVVREVEAFVEVQCFASAAVCIFTKSDHRENSTNRRTITVTEYTSMVEHRCCSALISHQRILFHLRDCAREDTFPELDL